MAHHERKGTTVNHTTPTTTTAPSRRSGGGVGLVGFGGIGARFSGGGGTVLLKLSGLLALTITALLALGASSASAATAYNKIGEITGPEAGVHFTELKSESVVVNDHNGHIYVVDNRETEGSGTEPRARTRRLAVQQQRTKE
jgi:hypothetical protein